VSISRQPPSGVDDRDRDDDWLADEGGIDWSTDPRPDEEHEWPEREPSRQAGLVRPPRVPEGTPSEAVLRRRRALAFGAVAAAVLIAIIIAVVATSGDGGSSESAATTTAPVTTSAQPSGSTGSTGTTGTTGSTGATGSSLEVTIPEGGNLSAGDSGDEVVTLQKALTELGLYDGEADGDFGSGTQAAVVAFQEAHNLKPDGIVGNKTAQALNEALAASGA
jgi:Putative peptidoglycan binding domain